jgi:hypothetical protein
MKTQVMHLPPGRLLRCAALSVCSLALLNSPPVWGDTVIVESRSGGKNYEQYAEMSGVGGAWANSSAKATASPCTAGIGCRYGVTNSYNPQIEDALGPGFYVSPILAHAGPGGVYKVEVIMGATATTASPDIEVSVWFTNCTGTVVSSKAGSPANTTTNFQYVSASATPLNVWRLVGYITNDVGVTQPTVAFQYHSGAVNRFNADSVLFTYAYDACKAVATPAVNGPLAAGQNYVNVQNIIDGVTGIKVYKVIAGTPDTYQLIGQSASVIPGSVNIVTLSSPLAKDDRIIASQTKDGIESCLDVPTPALVGGGSNPAGGIRVAFNIRETNVPPVIGADGGISGDVFFLGASDRVNGKFGAAPLGGQILTPSANWQTVTFTRGPDPTAPIDLLYCWSTVGQTTLDNDYGVLDSLALAINDLTDTGPYAVYIGKVINGSKVIQDFSGATNGEPTVMFSLPGASATSAQNGNLLAQPPGAYSPDTSVVVTTNAGPSGKSLLVSWQWNNTTPETWVQLLTRGTGTPNPIVDLRQPIQVEVLVLPVGVNQGTTALDLGVITNQAVWTADEVTLRAPVTGSGLQYQWYLGNPTTGSLLDTASTYTIPYFTSGNNGLYTVVVTDGVRTSQRATVLYAVDPIPTVTNQPKSVIISSGTTLNLSVGADPHNASGTPIYYQWRFNGTDLLGKTDQNLSIPGMTTAEAGSYDVYLYNNYGYATSAVATVSVVAPGTLPGTGAGLFGSYWTSRTNFTSTPTLTRVDPVLDFAWDTASPAAGISADSFTARWNGQIQALGDGQYTFYTISDDGVRLWVNGQNLVDNWTPHSPTTNSGTITLTGTNKYDVALEFFESTGGATVTLWWSKADGSLALGAVPSTQLYAASNGLPVITLVSPTNETVIPATGNLTLTADVLANHNVIGEVQFYRDAVSIATNTTAPFTLTIPAGAAGAYQYSARVFFNGGAGVGDVVYSATNSVTVAETTPTSIGNVGFSGGNLGISGTGPTGKSFVLFETPTLSPAAWTPVLTNAAGIGKFDFSITPGAAQRAFYRVGTQ